MNKHKIIQSRARSRRGRVLFSFRCFDVIIRRTATSTLKWDMQYQHWNDQHTTNAELNNEHNLNIGIIRNTYRSWHQTTTQSQRWIKTCNLNADITEPHNFKVEITSTQHQRWTDKHNNSINAEVNQHTHHRRSRTAVIIHVRVYALSYQQAAFHNITTYQFFFSCTCINLFCFTSGILKRRFVEVIARPPCSLFETIVGEIIVKSPCSR